MRAGMQAVKLTSRHACLHTFMHGMHACRQAGMHAWRYSNNNNYNNDIFETHAMVILTGSGWAR